MALLTVTEALQIMPSVLILFDLEAAFDTVNCQILISSLTDCEIGSYFLIWFLVLITLGGLIVACRLEKINFLTSLMLESLRGQYSVHYCSLCMLNNWDK